MHPFRTIGVMAWVLAASAGPASAATAAPGAACAKDAAIALSVQGGSLCVLIDDPAMSLQRPVLRQWIERSARIVADYYGRFPAPLVLLKIQGASGGGVHGGRTTNESGLLIQVSVGRDATAGELADDWVLVHEMVHLALPELGRRHHWLEEGLATYVEGIARAQFGNRDISDVWAEYRHSMPLGLPRTGEGGMDQTPTWGRTYWGGALYCLQADVAMREQTGNHAGLQTALRAILNETGGYRAERDIDEVLKIGDAATGTHVLQDLYREVKTTAMTPDLELLWTRLGVPKDPKSSGFDDHAPLAGIRIAITARPPA
ncbi:MAG TPA: hypothetical protein VNH21_00310, partial [Steroidobacteraceae bacterium]|nr:hypothetical protein [Steroidobacteraceae bacterium]